MGNTNENFRYDETDDFLMQDAVLNQGVHHNRSDNISPTIPRSDFVPINRSLSPQANRRGYWARNTSVSPTLARSSGFASETRSVSPTNKKGFWANDGWQETNRTILAKIGGGNNSGINSSGLSVNNGMQGGNYYRNNGVSINGGGFSSSNNGVSINRGGYSTANNGVSINGGGYSTGNEGISFNEGNTSVVTTSRSIGNTSLVGPNVNAGTNGISLGNGGYTNRSNGVSIQNESYHVNTGGIQEEFNGNKKVTFATNNNDLNNHHFVEHTNDQPGVVQVVEETTTTHGGGTRSNVPFGIERMFTEQDSYVENVTTTGRSREGTGVSLGQKIKTRAVVHTESPSDIIEVDRHLEEHHQRENNGGSYTVTETVHTEHKNDNKNEIIVQTQQPWQQKVGEWKTTSVTSSPRIEKPGMSYDLWETEPSPQPEFHQTHRSEIIETFDEPITNNAYTVHNSINQTPRSVKTTTTKSLTRHRSETDLVLPLHDSENYETETREVVVHKPVQPVKEVKEYIQPPEQRTIVKQTVVTETPRIETKYVEYKAPSPPPPPKQFIVKQPPKVETHYIEYETTPPPIQRIIVKKPPRVETHYVEYEDPPTPPPKEIIVRKPRPPPPPVKHEIKYVEYNKTPRQSEVSYEYHTVKPRYNTTTTRTYSPPPRIVSKPHVIVEEHVKKYTKPEIRTTYNVVSDYLAPTKASSLKSLHRVNSENHKIDLPPLQTGNTSRKSFTTVDRTIQRGSYDIVKPRKTSSLDEVQYGGNRNKNTTKNESVTTYRSYRDAWMRSNKNGSRTSTTTVSHNGTKQSFASSGASDGAATIKFTRPVTVVQDVPESNITNLYTQYRQANTKLVPL